MVNIFNFHLHLSNIIIITILSSISFSESLCRSRHFEKPTRSEFQTYMREILRTAKEKYRNRTRNPRAQAQKERIQ